MDDKINFRFNPNTLTPGPFQVSFSYREGDEGRERPWNSEKPALNNLLSIRIPNAVSGTVALHLDGALAFAAPINFQEILF